MPDPVSSDTSGDISPGLEMDDPDYQDAEQECKELLMAAGTTG